MIMIKKDRVLLDRRDILHSASGFMMSPDNFPNNTQSLYHDVDTYVHADSGRIDSFIAEGP